MAEQVQQPETSTPATSLEAKVEVALAILSRIEQNCIGRYGQCGDVHKELFKRIRVVEDAKSERHGACEASKGVWYRDWHFWHAAAAWIAIGYALWMGSRGVLH